jgi:hypothetical protein
MTTDKCLLFFMKYPQVGRVKTRLAQTHGRVFAARLYRAFVFDMLANLADGDYRLRICFDPPEKEMSIRRLLGRRHDYRAQRGADLGQRMCRAFSDCFSDGFRTAVLIGSDCPDLPRRVVQDAFEKLEHGCETVIGPSLDGGYYLIGFRKETFVSAVFSGPDWGRETVLAQTMDLLRAQGRSIEYVESWRDVDTEGDLADLAARNRDAPLACPRTMALLK